MKPPANQTGEPQLVKIEKPLYGGAFLARLEGKAVFVPLTLPGEEARIRMVESKPGYSTAEVDEILAASPQRVTPRCTHFGTCGGCHYQHASYETQLTLKQAILRETLERGGVRAHEEIAVLSAKPWHYRNRIRLAFDAEGNPGYRGRRSHGIVPIGKCPIAAPLLVDAALAAAEVARACSPAFRPTEIALFCDAQQASLLISIFTAGAPKIRFNEFALSLRERVPALLGAELVVESREGRRGEARRPRTVAQWGATSLTYQAAGFDYRVDQGAFFQVNRWLVDSLVDRVTAGHGGELAWDLFAGVGLFARRLTSSFGRVVAVESAPPAMPALATNLKGTRGAPVRGATLDFLRNRKVERPDLIVPDLIVLDPPRQGLGPEITTLLARIAAPAVAYVSCDPTTLARDLCALNKSGYAIQSITLVDLFPQTFHLETVVQLLHS